MKSLLSAPRRNRLAWALALAATLMLLAAVVLPPVLPLALRGPLMAGFHTLCHQLPDRSFSIDGISLAACHRCTGIYIGLVLGVLFSAVVPSVRKRGRNTEGLVLLVAVLPAAVDWGGDIVGLWTNMVGTRVATGLWFGALAGMLFGWAVAYPPGPSRAQPSRSHSESVS